ncbi:hypothetical protein [Yoonia sp. SS1-5]|uniref:Lipoprotein n=1 Tax=Yoonia rhodophyticola TaxID=3137370 RepID=A0AAN0NKT6_9RHOB
MKHFLWSLGLLAVTAACSSQPSPDMLVQNRDGDMVTGKFGSNWTVEELRGDGLGAVCEAGETATNFVAELAPDGSGSFSATCTR